MLILTCAIGYENQPSPFAFSLMKLNATAEAAAMVEKPDDGLSINLSRHFVHLDMVRETKAKYVFLTDYRDVIFQRDPGELRPDGLWAFEEHKSVRTGDCIYNTRWMKRCYGENVFKELADKPICCGGTVMGEREAVEVYLEAVTKEIRERNLFDMESPTFDGIDQSIHNYLVYKKKMATRIFPNGTNRYVYTLGHVPEVRVSRHVVLNDDGEVPYVVHQYDRHMRVL